MWGGGGLGSALAGMASTLRLSELTSSNSSTSSSTSTQNSAVAQTSTQISSAQSQPSHVTTASLRTRLEALVRRQRSGQGRYSLQESPFASSSSSPNSSEQLGLQGRNSSSIRRGRTVEQDIGEGTGSGFKYLEDHVNEGLSGDLGELGSRMVLEEDTSVEMAQDALLYVLEQAWNESRLDVDVDCMTRALKLCEWTAMGGQDPAKETARLREEFGSSWPRCNRVWLSNHVAYRCKDCGTTESSCICVECFDPADHEGHDFRIYKSNSGGCCDCGDPNAWRPSGNCKAHRVDPNAPVTGTDALPPTVRRGTSLVVSVLARELLLCICDVLAAISAPREPWRKAADHTWHTSPNLVLSSGTHLHNLTDHGTQGIQHFSTTRDSHVEKRQKLFEFIIRFLTQLCELGPPLRRLIAEELVTPYSAHRPASAYASESFAQHSCIEAFIRFGIFLESDVQKVLGILVLRLLIDDDFKTHYTDTFVTNYGYLITNYLHGSKVVRGSINEYLDRILCQLCNSTEQVRHLVTGQPTDMLGITVDAILQLGKRAAVPRRFDVVSLPRNRNLPSDGGDSAAAAAAAALRGHPEPRSSSRRARTLGPDGGFPPMSNCNLGHNNSNVMVDVASENVETRLFYRLIMDLRLLLVHDTVTIHGIMQRPEILQQALTMFSMLQEINPQTRKVDVHLEFENRATWEGAFLLEMEMVCAFFRLIDGFKQVMRDNPGAKPTALNALRSTTRALVQWLESQGLTARRFITMSTAHIKGGDPFSGVVASLTHLVSSGSYTTSIHIPLHRFWAGIFHAAIEETEPRTTLRKVLQEGQGHAPPTPSGLMGRRDMLDILIAQSIDAREHHEGEDSNSSITPAGFACLVAEHPLRVFSKLAQVRSRAWIRNGALVEVEPQHYLSRSWSWFAHDLDLFTLQYSASVMDGDSFIRFVAKRFEVDEVLSYAWTPTSVLESSGTLNDSARRKSRRQRRAESEKLDEDQLAVMCESMLHLVSVLVHDRTRLGERPKETLHKQVIHALASSPGSKRTFSAIEACIPLRVLEEGGRLEDVLAEVADFNPPSAKDTEGTYSLKESYWTSDLDLYYSHFTTEQRQVMEENFDLFHKRKRKRRDISSSLDSITDDEISPRSSGDRSQSMSCTTASASAYVCRLMALPLDAPIYKSFSHVPFNLLFCAELHGTIFRVLHACVREEVSDVVLARPSILLEALSLLYQGILLSTDLDMVAEYERELVGHFQDASNDSNGKSYVGHKPRSRSCDGTIAWTWPNTALQRCMSAPTDLRAMSMSINHRIDHIQHRVRLPYHNPILNACELVPLAEKRTKSPSRQDVDGENSPILAPRVASDSCVGSPPTLSGSLSEWSWPSPSGPLAAPSSVSSSPSLSPSSPPSSSSIPVPGSHTGSLGGAIATTRRATNTTQTYGTPQLGPSAVESFCDKSTLGYLPEPLCSLAPRAREEQSVGVSIFMLLLQLVQSQGRWGRDVHELAVLLVQEITEHMQKLAPGLQTLSDHFMSSNTSNSTDLAMNRRATSPQVPTPPRSAVFAAAVAANALNRARTAPSACTTSPSKAEPAQSLESASPGLSLTVGLPVNGVLSSPDTSDAGSTNTGADDLSSNSSATKKRTKKKKKKSSTSQNGLDQNDLASLSPTLNASAARQARIMAKFKKRQAAFLSSSAGLSTPDEVENTSQIEGQHVECALCREPASLSRTMGIVAYSGVGSVSEALKQEYLFGTPILQKPVGGPRHSCDTSLVRACGHHVHFDCLETYKQSLTTTNDVIDVEADEFRCPICRSLANNLLPMFYKEDSVPSALVERYLQRILRAAEPSYARDAKRLGQLFQENCLLAICAVNDSGASNTLQSYETLAHLLRSTYEAVQRVQDDAERLQVIEVIEAQMERFGLDENTPSPFELFGSWLLLGGKGPKMDFAKETLAAAMGQVIVALAVNADGTSLGQALNEHAHETEMVNSSSSTLFTMIKMAEQTLVKAQMLGKASSFKLKMPSGFPSLAARAGKLGDMPVEKVVGRLCVSLIQSFIISMAAVEYQGQSSTGRRSWRYVHEDIQAAEDGIFDLENAELGLTAEMIQEKVQLIIQGIICPRGGFSDMREDKDEMMGSSNERGKQEIIQHLAEPSLICSSRLELPGLLQLPQLYTDLYLRFCEGATSQNLPVCETCSQPLSTDTAMICLHCGKTLCLSMTCQPGGIQRRLTRHALNCTGVVCKTVCAFLPAYTSSAYVVINNTRMMEFGSVYLDSHGEADPLLRRGKPLYVSDARMQQLRRLVYGLGFTTEMVGVRRISHFLVE